MLRWEGKPLFLLWYFLIYSFLGFLLEVVFARVTHHPKKDRKCFLVLPLCPVYGVGAILIRTLAGLLDGPLWVMAAGFVGATAAELVLGLFYRYVLGVEFWDYRDQPFNLGGLVCLRFALYWTGLALVLVYGLDVPVAGLARSIPAQWDIPAAILLGTDSIVSALALYRTGTTEVLRWYR